LFGSLFPFSPATEFSSICLGNSAGKVGQIAPTSGANCVNPVDSTHQTVLLASHSN